MKSHIFHSIFLLPCLMGNQTTLCADRMHTLFPSEFFGLIAACELSMDERESDSSDEMRNAAFTEELIPCKVSSKENHVEIEIPYERHETKKPEYIRENDKTHGGDVCHLQLPVKDIMAHTYIKVLPHRMLHIVCTYRDEKGEEPVKFYSELCQTLPFWVDLTSVKFKYNDGLLKIILAKKENDRAIQIEGFDREEDASIKQQAPDQNHNGPEQTEKPMVQEIAKKSEEAVK